MIRRNTWMVLLVALVLGVAVWWAREQQTEHAPEAQAENEPTATPMPRLLPDLTPEDVERIVLEEPATGRRVVLVRAQVTPSPTTETAESQWRVEEPSDAKPPEGWQVNTALEGLIYARIVATLPPDTDPSTVGLDEPARRIVLHTREGDTVTLWIGASTPLQNGYYLRVEGDPATVAVGQFVVDALWELWGLGTAPEELPPSSLSPTP